MDPAARAARIFKTARFAKAARKAHIDDDELCKAIRQILNGQADDLGGGVFKKRLNKNMHRGIVLAKGGRNWIFVSLFAKNNRDNIDVDELEDFRRLAHESEQLTAQQLLQLLNDEALNEICCERAKV
jgi:hypothetical protein